MEIKAEKNDPGCAMCDKPFERNLYSQGDDDPLGYPSCNCFGFCDRSIFFKRWIEMNKLISEKIFTTEKNERC